jgi:hypothetical protein
MIGFERLLWFLSDEYLRFLEDVTIYEETSDGKI